MSVRMRHDGVKGEITVAERSVPAYQRTGWVVVDDRPAEEPTTEVAPRRKTPREN